MVTAKANLSKSEAVNTHFQTELVKPASTAVNTAISVVAQSTGVKCTVTKKGADKETSQKHVLRPALNTIYVELLSTVRDESSVNQIKQSKDRAIN